MEIKQPRDCLIINFFGEIHDGSNQILLKTSARDIGADNLHGVDDLVVLELPDGLGTLLAVLLGGLHANELVALLRDDGADLAAVGGRLVELLAQLELELHRLQSG